MPLRAVQSSHSRSGRELLSRRRPARCCPRAPSPRAGSHGPPHNAHGGRGRWAGRVPGPLLPPGGQRPPRPGPGPSCLGKRRGGGSFHSCETTASNRACLAFAGCLGVTASRAGRSAQSWNSLQPRSHGASSSWENGTEITQVQTHRRWISLILCLDYLTSEGWALKAIFHPASPFSHACKSAHRGFYAYFSFRKELEEYKFVTVLHASPVHNWS